MAEAVNSKGPGLHILASCRSSTSGSTCTLYSPPSTSGESTSTTSIVSVSTRNTSFPVAAEGREKQGAGARTLASARGARSRVSRSGQPLSQR